MRVPPVAARLALVLSLLLTAPGCGAHPTPTVVLSPAATRGDEGLSIRVTGLAAGSATQVGVTSTDAAGRAWASQATFTADAQGVVDPTTAASTAGSYLGVSPLGLLTSMQTPDATSTPLLAYRPPASGPSSFTVTAQPAEGAPVSATLTRTFFPSPLREQTMTVARDGFAGAYEWPAETSGRQPAVLVLGGSEGGNSGVLLAQALAARGVPALSVAYFDAPGLPRQLVRIPLEYFLKPLRWLRSQPGVDPARVWVSGASYGSEAALLLGADHPSLVHGVLSLSGGNTVTCSLVAGERTDTCTRAPWTRDGRPVPFTRQFDTADPTDVPAAVIAVERIRGPVLAVCGEADQEWHACQLSQAVLDRRRSHHVSADDQLLDYPDAGHFVDLLLPYGPIDPAAPDANGDGATPQANSDARADAWPKVLAGLSSH